MLSLQSQCINTIASNIDLYEGLGDDLSTQARMQISKIVCRHRRLDEQILPLFLGPTERELHLHDCAKLTADQLASIAIFAPNLETLDLRFSGQLNDEALDEWSRRFYNLSSVSLHGVFLLTDAALARFLRSIGPKLVSFTLAHSHRITEKSLRAGGGMPEYLRVASAALWTSSMMPH